MVVRDSPYRDNTIINLVIPSKNSSWLDFLSVDSVPEFK